MLQPLAISLITILPVISSSAQPGLSAGPAISASQEKQQDSKQPKTQPKTGSSALTGCVDEQDGAYVLVDDRTLSPIANLVADGFPQEGFAKHMGHKVTVRGTSNPGGTRPVFKVRTIEPVADSCAPQQHL